MLRMSISIAIDFDGTIVDHRFPDIGDPVPGAIHWMKEFQELGATLYLWTMRSDGQENGDGEVLTAAVEYCRKAGIEFVAVNDNPAQKSWTGSPKLYANLYIDDAAYGCPLRANPRSGGRPFVDWEIVGPAVAEMIRNHS